ncbi:hypothetical protein [Methylorubrum populi]|nr:hypothetical protein [Methylorubrum populi]
MRKIALYAVFPAVIIGSNLSTTPAIGRSPKLMTTRDIDSACQAYGWVGRSARECCSGRCEMVKGERCRCLGNRPSF